MSSIAVNPGSTTQVGEFLRTLFHSLEQHDIHYAVLRNYEGLPDRVGNDVDLWVRESYCSDFKEQLFAAAEKTGWKRLHYIARSGYPGAGDYYFYCTNSGVEIVHIDVWFAAHWKALSFIDTSRIFETRQYDKRGFYKVSPGVEASILLLKDLLYHAIVPERYRERIREFVVENEKEFISSIEKQFGQSLSKTLAQFVIKAKWQEIEQSTNPLRRNLFRNELYHNGTRQLSHWGRFLRDRLKQFIDPQDGFFVVLIGPDGSGKSTIADALLSSPIAEKLFFKGHYFHGRFNYLPEMKVLFTPWRWYYKNNRENHAIFQGDTKEPELDTTPPYSSLRTCVYLTYYIIDYLLGHFFRWKASIARKLIVADRYFYDYYLQKEFSNCPSRLLDKLQYVIPKPNLIVYLRNVSDVIYARKQELTIAEIDRQASTCRRLLGQLENGFIVETYNDQIERTCNDVQQIICEIMAKRLLR
jgi:thymidylate kinase